MRVVIEEYHAGVRHGYAIRILSGYRTGHYVRCNGGIWDGVLVFPDKGMCEGWAKHTGYDVVQE